MKKSAQNHWRGNPYKRPGSDYWYIVYHDASGKQCKESTRTRDLKIARERLAERVREVEKLKVGYVDRFAATREMPIEKLVVAFRDHLTAKNSARQYLKDTIRQIREFIAFAKVSRLPDIILPDAERFIADVRSRRSDKTRAHFAGALRSFGSWLHQTGRWDVNPFAGLPIKPVTRDRDRVFKRVGFRFEEAERLVEAAWARYEAEKSGPGTPSHEGYADAVRDRQALYWTVLTTGFRAKECASIRWEDLDLNEQRPSIRLAGRYTKNGNDARIPLQPFVVEALRQMRRRRSLSQTRDGRGPVLETDHVFHVPVKIAELVRKDAAFAGLIPQKSPTSRRVDFHALRKSCARILVEMGLHPKVIQAVLRHSDVRLTLNVYAELGEDDLFRELPGKLPTPRAYAGLCTAVCTEDDHVGASPGTTGQNGVAR